MSSPYPAEQSVIRLPAALAQVVYRGPDHARGHLRAGTGPSGARDAAVVVSRAVADAYGRGMREPGLTLDASATSRTAVREALEDCLVTHGDRLTVRRAGPGLLVHLRLRTARGAPARSWVDEV